MKVEPETLVFHDGAVPSPRTCPTSCSATERKSVWLAARPAVVWPKNQVVEPESSKLIAPPQGPKSVWNEPSAPAWPRAATVFSQLLSPDAWYPPVLPSPASEPAPRPLPPT